MSPRPAEPARSERGFTLLEVMVALVIAGLAVGALLAGSLSGLQSARVSGHYDEALVRARSRLDSLGHGGRLAPGVQSGDDGGGFRWRTQVSAIGADPPAPGSHEPLTTLYDVAVVVSWSMDGGLRSVALQSERVGLGTVPAP